MTAANNADTAGGLSGSGLRPGQLPGETPDIAGPSPAAVPHHADGVLNRKWVQNLLPLGSSLLFHLTLLAIAFGLYQTVTAVTSPNKEQVVIPATAMVQANKPLMQVSGPPSSVNPLNPESIANLGSEAGHENELNLVNTNPGGQKSFTTDFIGADAAVSTRGFGHTGPGDGPYGRPDGQPNAKGPGGGKFMNRPTGGNATRIVYLCDCSGSMISVFGTVKSELKKSVNSLTADHRGVQYFNIIFFSDGQPQVLFKDGVEVASNANKKLAMEFIDDAVASGGTLPLPAIKKAFEGQNKPDLIWAMTDGFDNVASFDEVVDTFKRGTADGATHVNCVFFQADADPRLEAVLTEIARNGHGQFTKFLKSDMQ